MISQLFTSRTPGRIKFSNNGVRTFTDSLQALDIGISSDVALADLGGTEGELLDTGQTLGLPTENPGDLGA